MLEEVQGRQLDFQPAGRIKSERMRWLWRDRIPLRSVIVVAGEKELGKSILTNAYLPAAVSRGRLPGELYGKPRDVVVATAEDDWRTVVKPRLVAYGADLDRVHRLRVRDDDGDMLLTLPDDVSMLADEIARYRDAGRQVAMFTIDPISAFIASGIDTHRDAAVRRALAPLADMAERLDLVVPVVAHLNKDDSKRLINRVSGAGAFVNAARSVLAMARHPEDPDGDRGVERVLIHVACNWGRHSPTLALRVESREVDLDDGSRGDTGHLVITGETDIGAEDLERGRDDTSAADVEEAIAAALSNGPRPSREVKTQVAAELDCTRKTVERHAVRMQGYGELNIDSGGFPRTTTWTLASRDTPSRDNGNRPVGTPPNSLTVPTDCRDSPTGFSAHR